MLPNYVKSYFYNIFNKTTLFETFGSGSSKASKLLICDTFLLAQGSNIFKSHTPADPSLAPFQSHLLHLHSVSPKVVVSLLPTHHVVRNSVAHLSRTQYGTEMRYTGFLKDFSVCHKRGKGCNPTKPSHFPPAAAGLVHFVAQTQLCRTVLFNSVSLQDYLSPLDPTGLGVF